MARLEVRPRETVSFEEFRDEASGPAVALDGYVDAPTQVTRTHGNFNHHETGAGAHACIRFTQRATCEQVALAVASGCKLICSDKASRDGLRVWVNDADPDVCLSVWLLRHPDAVGERDIDRLINLEGVIDALGGAATSGSADELDALGWVIEPWAAQRDTITTASAEDMEAMIDEVGARVDAWRAGKAGRVDLSAGFDVIESQGDVWALIEHHPLSRAAAVTAGARAFVSLRPGPVGAMAVSVGKAGPFVPLDLSAAYARLNELEGCEGIDRWGGSDLVGGSPREQGTKLSLTEICEVIADCYDEEE